MTKIYGIKNCDTMKKAFKWLEENNINHTFHDYKKNGIDEAVLQQALNEHGWENVINRRGTTWRQLPPKIQEDMNDTKAIEIAHDNPSIVKRPIILIDGKTHLGFKPEIYTEIFK